MWESHKDIYLFIYFILFNLGVDCIFILGFSI